VWKEPLATETAMPTNLALRDDLIEEAKRLGGHRTKKEAVTVALEEYVQRRKRLEILDLFGTIEFDPDYDYKALRRREKP
jgi:Arc/MetJ family transcription regulator